MDPQACFERWLEANKDGDRTEARYASTDYNAWRKKGGYPAEAKAFSNKVFGVPVTVTIIDLGPSKAAVEFYWQGHTWRARISADRFV